MAFIRRNWARTARVATSDLCFARVSASVTGTCIVDPKRRRRPSRLVAGRTAILVVATDPTDPNQTELLEYTSPALPRRRPSDWESQGLVTDEVARQAPWRGRALRGLGARREAGRDRRQLGRRRTSRSSACSSAAVSQGISSAGLGRSLPAIRACEVAWRSDCGELVSDAGDDCAGGRRDRPRRPDEPDSPDAAAAGRSTGPRLAAHPAQRALRVLCPQLPPSGRARGVASAGAAARRSEPGRPARARVRCERHACAGRRYGHDRPRRRGTRSSSTSRPSRGDHARIVVDGDVAGDRGRRLELRDVSRR